MSATTGSWTPPDWQLQAPAELKEYFLYLDEHVAGHLVGRPPAGKAAGGDLRGKQAQDPQYWRNFPVVGQSDEISRAEHIDAFDLGRIENRDRSDERVQIFPGGFVLEMTWTGATPEGLPVRARAGMLHFLDDELNLVRVHEYLDSAEVAPLLVNGVPGVAPKQPVPLEQRGAFAGWEAPAWRDWSPEDLHAHLLQLAQFVDDYVNNRPPPGGINAAADKAAGIDYQIWRNYRPRGQAEEVPRSLHLEAFDLLRFDDRQRVHERTYLFPGGFAYEMTWCGRRIDDGSTVSIPSFLIYFLDSDLRIVRLHEYIDSREVKVLLRDAAVTR